MQSHSTEITATRRGASALNVALEAIDVDSLVELFERYNAPMYYAFAPSGGDSSTKCCASGTCDVAVIRH
jgi:hypothetical protein